MNLLWWKEKQLRTVWKVEKEGEVSFLVGTAHFSPYRFEKTLMRLVQPAQTVLFEGPLDKETQGLHDRVRLLEDSLIEKPMAKLIARHKEIAYMLGLIPSSIVRPPKMPLSDQERKRLREALVKVQMLPAR